MAQPSNRRQKIPNQRSWTPKYVDLTVEEARDIPTRDARMKERGMDPAKKMLLRNHRSGVTIVQWIEDGPCRFNRVTSGNTTAVDTGSVLQPTAS